MTSYLAQANTGADTLTTTKAVSKPGGVGAGDVGVFWLVRWEAGASFPAVTAPAGAVLRGTITNGTEQTLCYLLKVSSETTFTFSWTGGRWSALSALFFSGVDPALDLAAAPFQSATGSGTAITTLTVTTVNAAALAWNVNSIATSGISHTPPTSFTEVADVSPWASAYRISPGTGSQSAASAANSPTAQWAAGLVALAPAAAGSEDHNLVCTATAAGAAAPPAAHALAALPHVHAASIASPTASHAAAGTARADGAAGTRPLASGEHAAAPQAHTAALATPGAAHTAPGAVQAHAAAGTTAITAHVLAAAAGATTASTATLRATADRTLTPQAPAAGHSAGAVSRTTAGTTQAHAAATSTGLITGDSDTVLGARADAAPHAQAAITHTAAGIGRAHVAGSSTTALTRLVQAAATAPVAAHTNGPLAHAATVDALAPAGATARGATDEPAPTGDDIEVTIGAPSSRWAAGQPYVPAWTVRTPHGSSWEVAAPW